MSHNYKIHILEPSGDLSGPATFEAALQTLRGLQGSKIPANPKFVELVLQLLKQHPSQASDPSCPHLAWGGDPLKSAQNSDEAVFSLSLPTANHVELLRLVVDTATALGLTVLDDQIGMVFLASGTVLPEERAVSWKMLKEQMDSELT